jgi:hypothetical protein
MDVFRSDKHSNNNKTNHISNQGKKRKTQTWKKNQRAKTKPKMLPVLWQMLPQLLQISVAISLIQEDEQYREWDEIQNACTLPMRWIFSVRKFCWRFVISLSNSYPATLSSLENMPAISLLHQGSPAGGFYGTWSQHFYDRFVLFDLFSARKRRKRNLSRNFFKELAIAKTLHLWSSCKVILKLYCNLESIND